MNRLPWTFPALVLLSLLVGCTSRDISSSHTFQVFAEDGITVAETTGGPKYDGELFKYVEVLRLKQDDSVEESLLTLPRPYLMDESGYFFVPDLSPPRIVCFDNEGNYSHTIGREGEGPGEFRSIEIRKFSGDVLTLFDSRTRRATRFSTDGILIDMLTTEFQKTGPARSYRLHGLHEDESGTQYSFWDTGDRDDEYQFHGESVTALDAAGIELFSIETPLIRTGFNFTSGPVQGGGGLPFSGMPVVKRLSDGRFIRSTGEMPEIDLFSTDGDLVGRITLELPLESTAAAGQEIRDYYLDRMQNATSDMSRMYAQAFYDGIKLPEYKAHWTEVIVDNSGFFWLKPPGQLFAVSNEVFDWLVLSPEGEYLGTTRLMTGEVNVCYGHLLTIQEDEETGAQDLIVYRIHPVVRGLEYPL